MKNRKKIDSFLNVIKEKLLVKMKTTQIQLLHIFWNMILMIQLFN